MTAQLDKKQLIQAYSTMRRIRDFEERVHLEFATGEIPGFVHLYAGEEASATGVIMHLRKDDYVASTHRGHGHCIAKGMNLRTMPSGNWEPDPLVLDERFMLAHSRGKGLVIFTGCSHAGVVNICRHA